MGGQREGRGPLCFLVLVMSMVSFAFVCVCVCVCVSQLKVDLLKSTNLKIVTLALISAIARLHAGGAV